MLKRYCGWHKKYFGKELPEVGTFAGLSVNSVPAESDGITTGICDDCRKLLAKEINVRFGGHHGASPELSSTCPKCGHHKLLNRNYCFKCEEAILSVEIPLLMEPSDVP